MTIRIKPGAYYLISSTEFSKYRLSRKREIIRWYLKAQGSVPSGYKKLPWIEIRKGSLPEVLKYLELLRYREINN